MVSSTSLPFSLGYSQMKQFIFSSAMYFLYIAVQRKQLQQDSAIDCFHIRVGKSGLELIDC